MVIHGKEASIQYMDNTPAALRNNRIRVLHLNAGNLYGGVETLLTTMAAFRTLCSDLEPHFGACYEGRLATELRAEGAPVHMLGAVRLSRPWTLWRARRQLRELLRRECFDVVICHMAWSLVVFAPVAKAAKVKVAFWQHGVHRTNWLDSLARRMSPDIAIANSTYTAESVRKHFPNIPVRILYYPGKLLEAPDAERWRAAVRREQGVDDETTVILQVSRMESWKGHLLHLHALGRLSPAENWICWIAGGAQSSSEEKYYAELVATAHQLGISERVKFLGQRADVPKLLAAADIFCQPNQQPEPFGLVFIEALWAGRPVVSTAIGGALEIVNSSCGILTQPNNPESLRDALRLLIQSPELRQRLGASGPSRARQLCDPGSQLKALQDLARAMITGRGEE